MWHRDMAWIDPVDAAARLAHLPGLSMLDSAMTDERLGRFSYVAADPFGRFRVHGDQAFWDDAALDEPALAALRSRLRRHAAPRIPGLPPFQGGAIGALSYEFGWSFERRRPQAQAQADVDLAFYDTILAFDHKDRACWLIASGAPETGDGRRRARAMARLEAFAEHLASPAPPTGSTEHAITWRPTLSADGYRAGVERVKAYIRAGDIYQANLAQRFVAALPALSTPWDVYRRLREANPAPFGAYLDCGARQILSTSPELFLRSDGRHVETRPIKGTIRSDRADDDNARRRLAASRKDRAENIMIVDLMRNDLSKVCEPASVEVPLLCGIESYAGLHHLVSAVTGTLRYDVDVLDLVAATFPGGSITGAPKLRAMEIIAEIEGISRGVYCGAIGAFGFDGGLTLNIAIRTIVAEGDTLELRTGGGITILSDAQQEYEETLTKAHRIFGGLSERRIAADACA